MMRRAPPEVVDLIKACGLDKVGYCEKCKRPLNAFSKTVQRWSCTECKVPGLIECELVMGFDYVEGGSA